jgi:arsenate reductase
MKWELSKIKVLFVCVHNSARSQMAEEFLRKLGGDDFSVESAGLDPKEVDPKVITVMREEGIDLSDKETKDVWDLFRMERYYNWVITVCEKKWEIKCPTFPGIYHRNHWGFPDPSHFQGTEEEKMNRMRELRDIIKLRIKLFIDEAKEQKIKDDQKKGTAS